MHKCVSDLSLSEQLRIIKNNGRKNSNQMFVNAEKLGIKKRSGFDAERVARANKKFTDSILKCSKLNIAEKRVEAKKLQEKGTP